MSEFSSRPIEESAETPSASPRPDLDAPLRSNSAKKSPDLRSAVGLKQSKPQILLEKKPRSTPRLSVLPHPRRDRRECFDEEDRGPRHSTTQ